MLSKEDYLLLKTDESYLESNKKYFLLCNDYFIMKSKDESVPLEKRVLAFEEALCLSSSVDMRNDFKSQINREEFLFFLEEAKGNFPMLDLELQKHYLTKEEFSNWCNDYYETIMENLSKGITEKISETENINRPGILLYSTYFRDVRSLMYLTDKQFENILFKVLEMKRSLPKKYGFLSGGFWSSLFSTFNEVNKAYLVDEEEVLLLRNHRERLLNIITSEKFFKELKKTCIYQKEEYDDKAIDRYVEFLSATKEVERLKPLTILILNGLFEEWSIIFKNNPNSSFLKRFGEVFLLLTRIGAAKHFKEALYLGALNNTYVSIDMNTSAIMLFNSVIKKTDLEKLNISIRSTSDGHCKMNSVINEDSFTLDPIDHFKLNTTDKFKEMGLVEIYKFIDENNGYMVSKKTGRITDEGWDLIDLNFAY